MDRPHDCPAPGCRVQVPHAQLACKRHWFTIPKDLRDAVWRAFRRNGQGSREHIEAVREAVNWLEANA